MKLWATYAPVNHLHKFYLVEAELHRVLGKKLEAMNYYEYQICMKMRSIISDLEKRTAKNAKNAKIRV